MSDLNNHWDRYMADLRTGANVQTPLEVRGTLTRLAGLVLEAVGLRVPVGSQCLIANGKREPVLAEVVGFAGNRAFLLRPRQVRPPGKRQFDQLVDRPGRSIRQGLFVRGPQPKPVLAHPGKQGDPADQPSELRPLVPQIRAQIGHARNGLDQVQSPGNSGGRLSAANVADLDAVALHLFQQFDLLLQDGRLQAQGADLAVHRVGGFAGLRLFGQRRRLPAPPQPLVHKGADNVDTQTNLVGI